MTVIARAHEVSIGVTGNHEVMIDFHVPGAPALRLTAAETRALADQLVEQAKAAEAGLRAMKG